jgi:hypothetical protein
LDPTALDSDMLSRWPPCQPSLSLTANGTTLFCLSFSAAAVSSVRFFGSAIPYFANSVLL